MTNINVDDIKVILKYKNVLASLVIFAVILFTANSIHSRYLKQEEELNNQGRSIENIKTLIGNLKRADKELKSMKAKIFNGDIFDFKKFMGHAAADYNATIDSFRPQTVKKGEGYNKVKVNIVLIANYKGLTNFVHTIESIASVTVTKIERIEGAGNYRIVFYVIIK